MSTTTLTSVLEKITAASPFEVQAIHQRVIQQLQEGGNATGLPVGTKAKDFGLLDLLGKKGIVAAKYKLLYGVLDYLRGMYLSHNIDLHEYNGTDHWLLPVTETFMIDEYSVIRSAL
ncbi:MULTISPECIES: hypothetical protein [Paenibacillus]|nr:hypothetical protein [Paenibacillus rhizosphaerae]